MGGGSGGGGNGGRKGGGGGSGQSAADVRYELDQMESGTSYANRNVPGATLLSEKEFRDLERMGKPERIKGKQERSRDRQRAAAQEAARNPGKGEWKFPSNPKKGDTVANGYGVKRTWTGGYWE